MIAREGKGVFSSIVDNLKPLFVLNLLWLLCCLPVITAGAATAAMHRGLQDLLREDREDAARKFLRAFRELFWQSTLVWLFLLFVVADAVILLSILGGGSLAAALSSPLPASLVTVVALAWLFTFNWSFPVLAGGGNGKLGKTLGCAFALSVLSLKKTFKCFAVAAGLLLSLVLCPPLVLIGFSVAGFLQNKIMHSTLRDCREGRLG